jgi:ferritin
MSKEWYCQIADICTDEGYDIGEIMDKEKLDFDVLQFLNEYAGCGYSDVHTAGELIKEIERCRNNAKQA